MMNQEDSSNRKSRKHYWRVRKENFRQRYLDRGWYPRGAYAEKIVRRRSLMQRIIGEEDEFYICCFQWKSDFWEEIIAAHRRCAKEPEYD